MAKSIDIGNANTIPFTRDQHARMVRLYEQGKTSCEIANIFGVAASTVRRRLVSLGATIRKRGGYAAKAAARQRAQNENAL